MFEMKANAWFILRISWGSYRKLKTLQHNPDRRSIFLFRANELSLVLPTIISKLFLFSLSVLVVLHPLSPDLFSILLQTYLGSRRRLTSTVINRFLALWLLIGGLQCEAQARWDRWRRERLPPPVLALWSGEVCSSVWAQFLLGHPSPSPPLPPHPTVQRASVTLYPPPTSSGLGWSSLLLLLVSGHFTLPSWCLKPCPLLNYLGIKYHCCRYLLFPVTLSDKSSSPLL